MKEARRQSLRAYREMAKLRIVTMVLVTTAFGFLLGRGGGSVDWGLFLAALLGTGAAAAGAAALNNVLDRDVDARMERTRRRPLPAGVIEPAQGMAFGIVMVLAGVGLLLWMTNLLAAFLVLLTAFLYVLVYTPLKRVTWINTSIGAIPGAMPPLSGWAAASGELGSGAWILFLILFAWQHPHFSAIAWMISLSRDCEFARLHYNSKGCKANSLYLHRIREGLSNPDSQRLRRSCMSSRPWQQRPQQK